MAKPNILFIHVDEMRFPKHFPQSMTPQTVDEFLANFMPNLYSKVWKPGVKFTRYYTAAADCTPGRGTFVTGLYSYQTGLFLTRESSSNAYATSQPQPQLQKQFPTYGKLLREAGYETPYIGKWHLSNCPASPGAPDAANYLHDYGFKGLTIPDPLGMPAQGLGLAKPQYQGGPPPLGDPEIAEQAVDWLIQRGKSSSVQPFCLTVGFVNPHDKQFFWGGTQANQFNAVYNTIPDSSSPTGFEIPAFSFNPVVGPPPPPSIYSDRPANWQSAAELRANKPKLQSLFKDMFAYCWTGSIDEAPPANAQTNTHFRAEPSSFAEGKHTAVAPYQYWARALDFYTQMMSAVDVRIGQVVNNIPENLRDNTVIVFCADHGEYASSHGLQGKGATVYEECYNVPLIVCDLSGRITADTNTKREQLVSSVDLLRMLVTLGNDGQTGWLTGNPNYNDMWGGTTRANLYGMLQTASNSGSTAGRQFAVCTTDEFFSATATEEYQNAPQHVIGLILESVPNQIKGKLGIYHDWIKHTTDLDKAVAPQGEYYNYVDDPLRLEMLSTYGSVPSSSAETFLFDTAIPQQLKKPLPVNSTDPNVSYREAQKRAIEEYWAYVDLVNEQQSAQSEAPRLFSTAFA